MYYRRMDPQPKCYTTVSTDISGKAEKFYYKISPIDYKFFGNPPEDMPNAEVWKDSDGEYYWRVDLVENKKNTYEIVE